MLRNLFVSVFLAVLCLPACAQAKPVVDEARWQVGAGFSFGPPDYTLPYIKGVTAYASYDLRSHSGVIIEAHLLNLITPKYVGESSFVFGWRYGFNMARFHPYIKALLGVGVFQIKPGLPSSKTGTDNYLVFAAGGGIEFLAVRHLNLRLADFEYQGWPGFADDGLTPWILTSGLAYKF